MEAHGECFLNETILQVIIQNLICVGFNWDFLMLPILKVGVSFKKARYST